MYKNISYAYPTSKTAQDMGAKNGCYIVSYTDGNIFPAYDDFIFTCEKFADAIKFADTLKEEYSPYSLKKV